MADYRISGVWKDNNGVITHYALHKPSTTGYYRAEKKTKSQVLSILDTGNTVKTWVWNYASSSWKDGQTVHPVGTGSNRYLRTDRDNTQRDNLDNLINAAWFLV
jgi:hypothetical protein